jgi:hypothetical protein
VEPYEEALLARTEVTRGLCTEPAFNFRTTLKCIDDSSLAFFLSYLNFFSYL